MKFLLEPVATDLSAHAAAVVVRRSFVLMVFLATLLLDATALVCGGLVFEWPARVNALMGMAIFFVGTFICFLLEYSHARQDKVRRLVDARRAEQQPITVVNEKAVTAVFVAFVACLVGAAVGIQQTKHPAVTGADKSALTAADGSSQQLLASETKASPTGSAAMGSDGSVAALTQPGQGGGLGAGMTLRLGSTTGDAASDQAIGDTASPAPDTAGQVPECEATCDRWLKEGKLQEGTTRQKCIQMLCHS